MKKISYNSNSGLIMNDGKLTLNFDESIIVDKTNGVFIDPHNLGGGLEGSIDDYTIKVDRKDGNGNAILKVNRDVVVSIFSMCQYKVTNRSSKAAYAVSNQIKTIDDIVDELNAVITAYGSMYIPMGVPHTGYILSQGDLFQLRTVAIPTQYSDGENTWPVAVDDGNRPQGVPITAFFYIESVTYANIYRVSGLTLRCLWSSLASYTAGTAYTYTETP